MHPKIKTQKEIADIVSSLKHKREKIVFTNGCFDLLHIGHVRYLEQAASLGNILIVGLNDDNSVRQIKGDKRPLIREDERAYLLASLTFVSYVVLFAEPTPLNLIKTIIPDILVKGADYKGKEVAGKEIVEQNGGRVQLIPLVKGKSTSNLIQKILKNYSK